MDIDTFLKRKHDIIKCLNWTLSDYKYAMLIPFDDFNSFADFLEKHHMSAGICNYLLYELKSVSPEVTVPLKKELTKTFNGTFSPTSEIVIDDFFFLILDHSMNMIHTVQEVKNIILLPRIELLQKTITRLNIELTNFIEKIH